MAMGPELLGIMGTMSANAVTAILKIHPVRRLTFTTTECILTAHDNGTSKRPQYGRDEGLFVNDEDFRWQGLVVRPGARSGEILGYRSGDVRLIGDFMAVN